MEKLLAQSVEMPAPLQLARSGWAYLKPRFMEYIEKVEDRYVHKLGGALFRLPGLVQYTVHDRVLSANVWDLVSIPHSTCV